MADDLFAVVASGQVKIHIAQRYALAEVQQAHRDLEARKTTGSTMLTLPWPPPRRRLGGRRTRARPVSRPRSAAPGAAAGGERCGLGGRPDF